MSELPSGTVTFLFTDVEGSTVLLRRLRARYGGVLADHQLLIREAVAESGGVEIDSQGDSFFFVFRRARDAVLAAANAQRALASHEWPEDGVVRVRMGIHTGEAAVSDGRYLGVAVHRAARISSAGHGGQVLLSQTTHNLLEDEEELPLDLRDLGEQRLKDFERPVRVYQLVIPGIQERFPPLRTLDGEPELVQKIPKKLPLWRRRRYVFGAAGLVAVAGVAAALALSLGGGGSSSVEPHSVAVIDPKRNAVVDSVPLDSKPTAVATGEGGVWVVSTDAKTLTKVNPDTRTIGGSAGVPGVPSDVAAGDGAVWVLHSKSLQPALAADAIVSRFEPHSVAFDRSIETGGAFDGSTYADPIAVGRGVWVAAGGEPTVYARIVRIDASTYKVAGGLSVRKGLAGILVGHQAGGLAADQAATWAVTGEGLIRIDPETENTAVVPGPGSSGPAATTLAYLVAVGEGEVWAAGEAFKPCNDIDPTSCKYLGGTVWKIDPGSNAVERQTRVGVTPAAIAVGAGGVWIADSTAKTVWRLDPASLEVVKKIELGVEPADLAVSGGLVWVAVGE